MIKRDLNKNNSLGSIYNNARNKQSNDNAIYKELTSKRSNRSRMFSLFGLGALLVVGTSLGVGFGVSPSNNSFIVNSNGQDEITTQQPVISPSQPTITPTTPTTPQVRQLNITRLSSLPTPFLGNAQAPGEVLRIGAILENNNQTKLQELSRYYQGSDLTLANLENFNTEIELSGNAVIINLVAKRNFSFGGETQVTLLPRVISFRQADATVEASNGPRSVRITALQQLFDEFRNNDISAKGALFRNIARTLFVGIGERAIDFLDFSLSSSLTTVSTRDVNPVRTDNGVPDQSNLFILTATISQGLRNAGFSLSINDFVAGSATSQFFHIILLSLR